MNKTFYAVAALIINGLLVGCTPPPPDISDLDPVPIEFNCDATNLMDVPTDPSERGPWAVGARTVQIGDLKTEVWYPAAAGSEANVNPVSYDLRQFLPDADAAKIPDDAGLNQPCDCFADLPVDTAHGPYPVIILIHGTAAFRTASLPIVTHWASRGFVVISADNPDIQLKDIKQNAFGARNANQGQDTIDIIDVLQEARAPLDFLDGSVDINRIGISGHSAGGNAAGIFGFVPGVRTVIPLAAGGSSPGDYLNSSMIIGSELDGVVNYQRQVDGYPTSPAPKRFIGIGNTGHLVYTELCTLGREQGGLIPLVESFGVEVNSLFRRLGTDGCGDQFLDSEDGWELINYASTAAFEETLQCNSNSARAFDNIEARFPQLIRFEQEL